MNLGTASEKSSGDLAPPAKALYSKAGRVGGEVTHRIANPSTEIRNYQAISIHSAPSFPMDIPRTNGESRKRASFPARSCQS